MPVPPQNIVSNELPFWNDPNPLPPPTEEETVRSHKENRFNLTSLILHTIKEHFPDGCRPYQVVNYLKENGYPDLNRQYVCYRMHLLAGGDKRFSHRNDLKRRKIRGKNLYLYYFNEEGVQRTKNGIRSVNVHVVDRPKVGRYARITNTVINWTNV